MKYVDEFRDAELGRVLAGEILATVEAGRSYKIMEVCGGHTHTIYKYGVDDLLPENVELVHGPGCPVCVIPMGRVDDGIAVARRPEVIFTCFGDMMRVPGGGRAAELPWLDHLFVVESDYVPRLQEAHATIYHLVLDAVGARL